MRNRPAQREESMIALSSREERKAKTEGENRVKRRASAKGASSFRPPSAVSFSFSTLGLFNLDREKKLTTPFEKKNKNEKNQISEPPTSSPPRTSSTGTMAPPTPNTASTGGTTSGSTKH